MAPATAPSAWQAFFSRQEARVPLCKHGEACKKQTVRKAGANQGRTFYSCMRAEGPRSNPEANCGFFAWTQDWEAQLKRKREGEQQASRGGGR